MNWFRYFLCSVSKRIVLSSSTRLFILALIGLWAFSLATLPVMAQTNSTVSSNSTTPAGTTSSPSSSSNSTESTTMSNSNGTTDTGTTMAPGPNTTPSGAMSVWTSCNSLLTSGFLVALNWLLFSKIIH